MAHRARAPRRRRAQRARARHLRPAPRLRRAAARPLAELEADALEAASAALEERPRAALEGAELRAPGRPALPRPVLRADRRRRRRRRAGRALPRRARAALRLPMRRGAGRAGGPAPRRHRARGAPELREAGAPEGDPVRERPRRACFDGEWTEVPVLDRGRMGEARAVAGPAIVAFARPRARAARAGRARSTPPARSCWSAGRERRARSRHAVGALERARRDRRGDGRGADPRRVLLEHQGAPRLLRRALRRRGPDGRPGRAHPRAPRRDARGGRGRDRRATRGRATCSPSTTPSRAARTCPTSRSSPPWRVGGRAARLRRHARPPLRRRRDEPGLDARRTRARSSRRGS